MITTDTGAKKIENSDNWRQIFDAHNDSVDAEDKIVPEMAPIVNGNKSTVGAAIGEYVLVRNSSITGITDGAYTAAKAIPANTTIDSTYLTAVGTGGALNSLNSKMTWKAVTGFTPFYMSSVSTNYTEKSLTGVSTANELLVYVGPSGSTYSIALILPLVGSTNEISCSYETWTTDSGAYFIATSVRFDKTTHKIGFRESAKGSSASWYGVKEVFWR